MDRGNSVKNDNKINSNIATTAKIDEFVNDVLKEDLNYLERYINIYNDEIMEFVQLKNTIQTLRDTLPSTDDHGAEDDVDFAFKTQINIGGNVFMEAKVENAKTILVDVGKSCFLEFTLDEAMKYIECKVKILTKECDILREESIKKRCHIKLALMCMAEQEKLYVEEKA